MERRVTAREEAVEKTNPLERARTGKKNGEMRRPVVQGTDECQSFELKRGVLLDEAPKDTPEKRQNTLATRAKGPGIMLAGLSRGKKKVLGEGRSRAKQKQNVKRGGGQKRGKNNQRGISKLSYQ